MATEEQQLQLGREVAEYFTRRPNIEFVGFAGLGRHGGALILEEKDNLGQLFRKLVIKYSLGALSSDAKSDADADLRNEYMWLEMLRGAEHIVRLVPFADCSLNLPGISTGETTFEDSLDKMRITQEAQKNEGETSVRGAKISKIPVPVRRSPTFALEYVPNGTVFHFVNRLRRAKQLIPNRIMWRFWLCMVRQCVAMAFPPMQSAENYSPIRERIDLNREFFTLTQNSPHMENFLIAEQSSLFPDSDHDPGVPPVKVSEKVSKELKAEINHYVLIDFGRGKMENPEDYKDENLANIYECGTRINLWGAATAMMEVACPLAPDDELEIDEEVPYSYWKDNRQEVVVTLASQALRESAEMDQDLRDILARCMAPNVEYIPPISEVLAQAEDKVANRGAHDDPWLEGMMDVEETDSYIRGFLQNFIFNAST